MSPSQTLHKGASLGFSNAAAYDAYRPSYPPAAVETFLNRLRLAGNAEARIVEVAAGTGKFTELLVARPEQYKIIAVEPHEGMRKTLVDKRLGDQVEVVDGFAAKMPVEGEWGDACVVAQAFHWFANETSLKEIHRVLVPAGVLGLVWNIEDYNKPAAWRASTAWEQSMNDLLFSLGSDGQPRFKDDVWRKAFSTQLHSNPLSALYEFSNKSLFTLPIGEERVPWTVWLTEEALLKRIRTLSQVAVLEGERRAKFDARFREILKDGDVERNEKGEIAVHGVTFSAWTSKL